MGKDIRELDPDEIDCSVLMALAGKGQQPAVLCVPEIFRLLKGEHEYKFIADTLFCCSRLGAAVVCIDWS